nr:hypothetical protein [Tanacetum cinerariifolium]
MNKLVRHNLVRGLPTKSFNNDHNCTACLKGKQHKASSKSKLVNSVTKPLHTLHMDLFDPTFVSSISHKCYCLVVTDDFSREFSNARTPQQNGVAERRNITLIEAARTMLVDAKLPVTFWAEAINTACYVQNSVLVNKSQNKTPYELFNGRTPAIGFLKPFGCHVMILNTLDNLGKFEAKGDEGYFIGYSMSSKAFRVFNKRTRRVEENLHVEFLQNKAIEKGIGPNWLFDIDSLTKSMNYVPVDAGTNSTNFSGTKDAANQEVKKDVSSLRYIALPNWAHDALLESSSSKPHDGSSTKVPEGSRNPNPTAFSSNPPADQMETLTVESPIPTVNSPVPTACLNDSPEPSNEAIGVEADVSNMETTISASPTPTLRIYKDHPKIEPKKVSDALQDPSWVEAMQEELLQFKIQKVWTLVDCPQGVRPIGTKWVLKNKKDKRGIILRNKARLDPAFPAKVYKVEKAMYGLHQAPRAWYVLQKEDGIFLSQDKYIGDILKKFGFSDVRSSNTLMDKENPWRKDGTGKDVDLHLYRSMIVKRIFPYLKGHPKLGLWYPKASSFDLVAFSDSDYGGASQDRKSTTGGTSPLRYALTVKPTIFVSYIRQFWSNARIETTDKGTHILATVEGIQGTGSESSLKCNLKLKDEHGIVSIQDTELFENLTLMG